MFKLSLTKNSLSYTINLLLFIFFSTLINIKNAYYIAPSILFLISILYISVYKSEITISKYVKYYIFSAIGYYLISFVVAFINGDAIPNSFKSDHFLILSIPIILLIWKYKPTFNFMALVFGVSSFIYGISAIYNKFFIGIERAFSYIHPIPAGAIIMTVSLYCFIFGIDYLRVNKKLLAILMLCSASVGLLGNILTGSRGTWMIFPVAIIVLSFHYRKYLKHIVIPFLSSILALVIIASFIPQTGIQKRYNEAISDVTQYFDGINKETSIGMRFELWRSAFQGIKERPLLGWGKNGMDEKRLEQSKSADFPSIIKDFPHTHNLFIEQAFYRGMIGLFFLVLFIYTLGFYYIKMYKEAKDEEKKLIALLGIINVLALLSFSLSDALLRLKEYAMFFYMCNVIFYAMTIDNNRRVIE
ncbi:O-antigen ligase family protein [Avibacterium sp. 21-586]|uniref:O-antigen ligase family protein n=1 Tax=Avibacterium sp. 21-586 TaxID=2911534 RepID=UPI002247C5F7|nr:O-antigen ligase family protein [Avibacterium sp. 21-586]MCW9710206.1 O-antigen ligase family protein [Avibacterium sp. 21-586]